MDRARLRWGAAIVAAVVVAEVAVVLLRPRSGVIEPAPVRTESYFSASQLERARDYRRPQLAIYGGVLAVELGLLALLVARPPQRLRGPFRRPVLAGAAAGAALSVAVSVAVLPLQIVSRERAKDVGLVTQAWTGYARDKSISWGIGAVIAGLGAATAVGLIRRYPRGWWVPGSVIVVAFGAVSIYAGPVVLDPIFNKFQALPAGQTRDDVLELAERAGVDIGEVYSVDASRRSTAANAYVAGLGRTKRVVLYDTLLENFERDEVRLVVAHELAHQHYRDVPNGLLYVAIVAPFGLLAVARADAPPGPARRRARTGRPAGARAQPHRHDDDGHDDLQPAQPPRRGARGLLRADADRRGRAVHRLREADRAAQPLRPRPARLADRTAGHPSADDRAHRDRRRVRARRAVGRGPSGAKCALRAAACGDGVV